MDERGLTYEACERKWPWPVLRCDAGTGIKNEGRGFYWLLLNLLPYFTVYLQLLKDITISLNNSVKCRYSPKLILFLVATFPPHQCTQSPFRYKFVCHWCKRQLQRTVCPIIIQITLLILAWVTEHVLQPWCGDGRYHWKVVVRYELWSSGLWRPVAFWMVINVHPKRDCTASQPGIPQSTFWTPWKPQNSQISKLLA